MAEHCGPRGLLHPSLCGAGGVLWVDWIAGLPTKEGGFDTMQNHADLLSGKAYAVPTRATATAADAAEIIRDLCLRSGDGFRWWITTPSSRATCFAHSQGA
jgi:hypothetical protein